jgi:tetratricopeptide (TPR) repeat protein
MQASQVASADVSINEWKTILLVILVFTVIFGSLTITSFIQQSPTIDEPVHLLGGYSYLKWGDFRVNPEHPPLAKMWAALPLLWMNIRDPRPANSLWKQILESEPGGPVYPFARDMFFAHNDAWKLFFYGKLQMVVLSIVLAIFVFLWSRELFGIHAAAISLILYGLDPTILAQSAIIHTDLPFAAWFFIGTYFFGRVLREFSWLNLLMVSVMFGFAATTKHSFVVIAPVWLVLGGIEWFRPGALTTPAGPVPNRKQRILHLAAIFSCSAVAAYLLIWSAYGFRFGAAADERARLFMTQVLPAHRLIAQSVSSFIIDHRLFPEALIAGYLYNLKVWQHSSYLLGELSNDGFWSYFPIAFIVKTPLPTLLLLAVSVGLIISKRKAGPYLWFIVPPLLYFLLAVLSRFNIGIRHLLPIYPFLFVLIGATVSEFWRNGSRIRKSALAVLGVWYVGSALASYPHHLSYFNELVGGAKNGHKVLLDSNLDWGQDLKGLKKWLDESNVKKVQLFYFGTAEPKYYGIDDFYSTENLAGGTFGVGQRIDLPEHLAISANFLYGGELFLPKELVELLRSYRLEQPVGRVGYSILVYKLNLADSRVYENAAVMTARKGAPDLAGLLLEKALQINPASANGHFQLAALLARRGEWNLAAENFREALRIEPGHADAHYGLAQILKRQGQIDEAAHHYQEAIRILKEDGARAKRGN